MTICRSALSGFDMVEVGEDVGFVFFDPRGDGMVYCSRAELKERWLAFLNAPINHRAEQPFHPLMEPAPDLQRERRPIRLPSPERAIHLHLILKPSTPWTSLVCFDSAAISSNWHLATPFLKSRVEGLLVYRFRRLRW